MVIHKRGTSINFGSRLRERQRRGGRKKIRTWGMELEDLRNAVKFSFQDVPRPFQSGKHSSWSYLHKIQVEPRMRHECGGTLQAQLLIKDNWSLIAPVGREIIPPGECGHRLIFPCSNVHHLRVHPLPHIGSCNRI